jgi:Mg2+/citrate symporter
VRALARRAGLRGLIATRVEFSRSALEAGVVDRAPFADDVEELAVLFYMSQIRSMMAVCSYLEAALPTIWAHGVVPVLGATGAAYGVPPEVIGRAALMGMPLHALSPFIAPIYLVASLIRADVGQLQRFGLPWAILLSLFATLAAMATGAILIPS